MAQKLSVQIALEGGAEVQRQLEAIGETGAQSFKQIDDAAKSVGGFRNLDPGVVEQQLKQLGVTGVASINSIQKAVQEAGRLEGLAAGVAQLEAGANKATAAFGLTRREINGIRTALRQVDLGPLGSQLAAVGKIGAAFKGPGIAIAAVGAAIAAVTEATIGFAKSVGEISEKTKLDQVTQAFEKLKEAASRGYGAQGTQALKELQAAAEGTGKAAELAREKLVELGLVQAPDIAAKFKEISDSIAGLSRTDAATKVLQALQVIQDPIERAGVAAKFFGEQAGPQLAKNLGQGASAASQYATAVSHLITQDDMTKADNLNNSLSRLGETIKRGGTLVFAPTLAATIDGLDAALGRLIARGSQNPLGGFLQGAALLNPFNAALQATAALLEQITPKADSAGQTIARIGQGASLLNPVNAAVQGVLAALGLIPPAANQSAQALAQTGQAGQQAGQQAAQGLQLVVNPLTGMPELVNTTNQNLATLGQTGQQSGQQAAGGLQLVTNALTGMPELVKQATAAPEASSWTSWASTVVGAIQSAISKLLEWIGLKDKAGSGGGGGAGSGATGKARGGLIGGRGTGTSDSNLAWLSRGEYVINAASVRHFGAGFFAALNAGRIPGFAAGGMANGGPVGGAGDIVSKINQTAERTAKIDANVNTAINMLNDIGGGMISLAQALERLIQTVDGIKETATGTNRMTASIWGVVLAINEKIDRAMSRKAAGGLIGGRGTGTSDSNLAWLSRGEFVINAAAVRHFGAGFFAALNAGMFPGFALGGLVPRAIPAFAGGGMNHVTIQFPGVPSVGGLRASSAVVEELQRSAALAQVRSGGRKPSRYS